MNGNFNSFHAQECIELNKSVNNLYIELARYVMTREYPPETLKEMLKWAAGESRRIIRSSFVPVTDLDRMVHHMVTETSDELVELYRAIIQMPTDRIYDFLEEEMHATIEEIRQHDANPEAFADDIINQAMGMGML